MSGSTNLELYIDAVELRGEKGKAQGLLGGEGEAEHERLSV